MLKDFEIKLSKQAKVKVKVDQWSDLGK